MRVCSVGACGILQFHVDGFDSYLLIVEFIQIEL